MGAKIFLLALIFAVRLGGQNCDDRSVSIKEVREAGVIRLYAETDQCLDASITITLQLENMRASQPTVFTLDTKGRSHVELVKLVQADGRKAWKYNYDFRWYHGGRGGVADATVYQLPFEASRSRRLVQGYHGAFSHQRGTNSEYAHDWDLPEGSLVLAARAGTVVAVRQDSNSGGPADQFKACSNYIIIRHADRTYAEYLHLQHNGILVPLGAEVVAGQPLARSGNTGYSQGPHLHFAVFKVIDGRNRETLPVKFMTKAGAVESLVEGKSY